VIKFAAQTCRSCPVRDQCTRSTSPRVGRQLTVPPREIHHAQLAARATQDTPDWQARYAVWAGVEGTIRQAVAVTGTRRARYCGLPKTRLEHVFSAVALNLIRLDAPLERPPPRSHQNQPPHPPRTRPGSLIESASRVSCEVKPTTSAASSSLGRLRLLRRIHNPDDRRSRDPRSSRHALRDQTRLNSTALPAP